MDNFETIGCGIPLMNCNNYRHAETRNLPRPLHPFPARMAPEVAFEALSVLPKGSLVFDPMCGSGTVLRQALASGHRAVGFDTDPLAVLISRVIGHAVEYHYLMNEVNKTADQALTLRNRRSLHLPWIDDDEETREFVSFWFGEKQIQDLRALTYLIDRRRDRLRDVLRLILSKTIVTKEPKASLARDTSHSRPHRVKSVSDFDVIHGFCRAAADVAKQLDTYHMHGSIKVNRSDARKLPHRFKNKADMVVTSPPYGNAIDYLRGHRLSLVWFGYTISQLRSIRKNGIGSERGPRTRYTTALKELTLSLGPIDSLDSPTRLRLIRYAKDIRTVLRQIHKALKPMGHAVIVIGNSTIKGTFMDNSRLVATAANQIGFKELSRYCREIPANHRYLPPPSTVGNHALTKRMREEIVLTLGKESQVESRY